MRRVLLFGAGVLVGAFLTAAIGGYVWYRHEQTKPLPEVIGSGNVEFVPEAKPERKRTRRAIANLPWPTYGLDNQRTHLALGFAHRPPYRTAWVHRAQHLLEFPPSVGYGRVYIPNQRGRFNVVTASTGRLLWRKLFRRCIAASPTLAARTVYQAVMHALPCPPENRGARGFVIAMNAFTGKRIWRFDAGVVESTPLYANGVLYFGSWDRNLYAVNAKTGKLRWRYRADDELNTSPAYAGGSIYIASKGGRVHAVNARTGKARWVAESYSRFGGREQFYATPTLAYGRVYIGNTDGNVYAYGAGTGKLIWASNAGSYVYSAAAVWRRTVYVGSYDGRVYALDAATGQTRWTYESPGSIHGAPTVMGGLVYFSVCGTCGQFGSRYAKRGPRGTFALDARTGRLVWRFGDGTYSPIVADSKRVYLTGRTRVYALVERRTRQVEARPRSRRAAKRGTSSGTRATRRTGRRSTPQNRPRRSRARASAAGSRAATP